MIDIQKEHLSPFFSILIGVNLSKISSEKLHEALMKIINGIIYTPETIQTYTTSSDSIGDASVEITPYSMSKAPSWTTRKDILNFENHIAITITLGNYVAFYFSEKGMKDSIRDYFKSTHLPYIKSVDISHLNYLFINEDNIKMLWLLGIHGKNTFKADSKVLGGNSVAESLDPLEDQSYMMSAVRTQIGNNKSIGLNPFKSSIWRGPCSDWKSFEDNIIEVLDTLNSNNKNNHSPIGILASPINELNNVLDAYDFSVIDNDFIQYDISQTKSDLLKKINLKYKTEITYSFNTSFTLKVFFEDTHCGDVTVKLNIKDYEISFEIVNQKHVTPRKSDLNDFIKIFKNPEFIKCWYESGHAVVNSWIFKTDYKDVIYNGFILADFENYTIIQEKPTKIKTSDPTKNVLDLNAIGTKKSLFCWIKNRWSSRWNDATDFNTTENPTGWLYCDDGAGEKADFIHVDEHEGKTIISLIHIKAAGSSSKSRRVSVGAHDIVLSQAVKNLRYANRKNLINDLTERAINSQNKMCWHKNIKIDSAEFLNNLNKLSTNPNNIKTRVIVIQPHTLKNYYEKLQNSNIKRQLDVLLVSTDNAIKSSGAEFHIIGFNDD